MNYLSISRSSLRSFIRKQRYSTKHEGITIKAPDFIPENSPTYSNGLLSKETLDKFHSHVGNRDVVGYGINGRLNYLDSTEFPYPSLRFAENTPDVMALREEEKQCWSTLSIEQKKALYRASFCNNFAELRAPTGHWKDYLTSFLILMSITLSISLYMNEYGLPYMPKTFNKEWEMEVQRRKLLLGNDNIEYHSGYNYDTNKWEK